MSLNGSEVIGYKDIGACFGTGFVQTATHKKCLGAGTHAIGLDEYLVLFWDVKLFQHDIFAPDACQSVRSLTHELIVGMR